MCDTHPRYEAIQKPRAYCLNCWIDYAKKHPDVEYTNKDVSKILISAHNSISKIVQDLSSKIDSHIQSTRTHGWLDPALGELEF